MKIKKYYLKLVSSIIRRIEQEVFEGLNEMDAELVEIGKSLHGGQN